jgi:hypothetical protein
MRAMELTRTHPAPGTRHSHVPPRWLGHALAAIAICWAINCGPYDSNTWPLAFGMTPDQASAALGVPLLYYSGPPGSEVLVARGSTGFLWRFPVGSALALQFRRGHLTGWKENWTLPKPWIIY